MERSKRKVCSICGAPRPSRNWIDKGWTTIMRYMRDGRRLVLYGCPEHSADDLVAYMDAYAVGAWKPREEKDEVALKAL